MVEGVQGGRAWETYGEVQSVIHIPIAATRVVRCGFSAKEAPAVS